LVLCSTAAAEELISQLASRFPAADLMDALGIIYPQYWFEDGADSNFEKHLRVIKMHYAQSLAFSTAGMYFFPSLILFYANDICA
jgi:hypothetical protein